MHTLALVSLVTAVTHEVHAANKDGKITVREALDIAHDSAIRLADTFGVADRPLFSDHEAAPTPAVTDR